MASGKKKSFMGSIAGALFEDETGGKAAPGPAAVEPARPFQPFGGGPVPNFSTPTSAAPQPPIPGQTPFTPAPQYAAPQSYAPPTGPVAPDPEALTAVQAAVYVAIGNRASNFVRFIEMHEALGKPADTGLALRALAASDKTTPESIATAVAGDVQTHLDLLETFCQSVDSDFAGEMEARLGTKDREIKTLIDANEKAAAEIKRHSEEVQVRTQQIAGLQQARAEEEAAIGRGKARMDAAEDYVRNNLRNSQQLFSAKA
jgi:hypothetical protein